MASRRRLDVDVVIDARAASFENGTLQLQLESVPFADARAEVIAQTRADNVRHHQGNETRITLQLNPPIVSEASHYHVRAYVGFRDDHTMMPGDYASEQSYPVLTHGHPDRVEV